MHFADTVKIITDRTLIRKIHPSDLQRYFEIYSDGASMPYRIEKPFASLADAQKALADTEVHWVAGTKYRFAVEEKSTGILMGTFLIKNIEDENCEIGYSLDKKYRQKGIMYEVCSAMITFLFSEQNMETIFASVRHENEASRLLLEKLNFRNIGRVEDRINFRLDKGFGQTQ